MPKLNRRSVSIRATSYRRLAELAATRELSGSGLLEELIAREAERAGVREFTQAEVEPPRSKQPEPDAGEIASAYFTF